MLLIRLERNLSMVQDKIAILMSTYNGHEYVADQIQSIINQTYQEWKLYIRDDGSSDDTRKIIESFEKKDPRIILTNKNQFENLGSVGSFFELLKNADADFYMFSDQDDYWKQTKVADTLSEMRRSHYQDKPCCVYSNLQVVDNELKGNQPLLTHHWQEFTQLIFTNNAYGCTMMINQVLKDMVHFNELDLNYIYMHDWWLMLIAAAFGEIRYLDEKTILYRQHEDNQVGASKKTFQAIAHRLFNQKRDRIAMQRSIRLAHEFSVEYGKDCSLSERNHKYVSEYGKLVQYSNFFHNLVLAIKLPPQSIYKLKELFYSYIMICFNRDYLD